MTKLDTKMIVHARIFFLITALSITAGQTLPRQSKETTIQITEPSVGTLADLFKQADIVALVETVDGNTESYSTAVYKAKVTQSFKGPPSGSTIYFGPHIGMRLGWEYVVFLRAAGGKIAGSMGVDVNEYLPAAKRGVTKVNIDTDGRLVWTRVHREFFRDKPGDFDFRPPGKIFIEEYAKFIASRNALLGSANQLADLRQSLGR